MTCNGSKTHSRGTGRWWTDTRIILALIAIHGFLIRTFSAVKHEVVLHEYDPYFNYKCTEFIHRYGVAKFWKSFDDGKTCRAKIHADAGSWYPFGRKVGQTTYPGLMLLAYAAHTLLQYVGINASLKTVCIFLPPVCSLATVYAVYMLAKEITNNECAALTSAFFIGSLPALISRTVTGNAAQRRNHRRCRRIRQRSCCYTAHGMGVLRLACSGTQPVALGLRAGSAHDLPDGAVVGGIRIRGQCNSLLHAGRNRVECQAQAGVRCICGIPRTHRDAVLLGTHDRECRAHHNGNEAAASSVCSGRHLYRNDRLCWRGKHAKMRICMCPYSRIHVATSHR